MRYRTEIVIPPDGYVCLQLPSYIHEGRAIVTVFVSDRESKTEEAGHETDTDRHDIEWWDEFDEENGGESTND